MLWEASGLGFGSILNGVGTDLGRVLDEFWEEIWSIPGDSGLFWAILGYGDVLRRSWADSGGSGGIFEESGSRIFFLFSAAVSGLCWALLVFTKFCWDLLGLNPFFRNLVAHGWRAKRAL